MSRFSQRKSDLQAIHVGENAADCGVRGGNHEGRVGQQASRGGYEDQIHELTIE
jgi:hypothetical protein